VYEWNTTAKLRWYSRTLLDIYSNEFVRVLQNENIKNLITNGLIKVNNEKKDLNYLIKNGDVLSHIRHRYRKKHYDFKSVKNLTDFRFKTRTASCRRSYRNSQ
jgi:hypothetical protein